MDPESCATLLVLHQLHDAHDDRIATSRFPFLVDWLDELVLLSETRTGVSAAATAVIHLWSFAALPRQEPFRPWREPETSCDGRRSGKCGEGMDLLLLPEEAERKAREQRSAELEAELAAVKSQGGSG